MNVARGFWTLGKEVLRHLLRRPVIGIAAAARTVDGRWLLVRRADTGQWALPGGTLEWGETLKNAICRELSEEAGVDQVELGELWGIYSAPERDRRFHAVTILVTAVVGEPVRPPVNPIEIREARLFDTATLPHELAHGMTDMIEDVRAGTRRWE